MEYSPYESVHKNVKEVMAKFIAFTVDSKKERYIKGSIVDLTDIRWREGSTDSAMHLELRFVKWKREFKEECKKN